MHAVAPYLMRCYNKELDGRKDQRYQVLNCIGQYDLFYLIKDFIEANQGAYKIVEDTKQVYQFSDLEFDENSREISAWFNVGNYGIKTDIINIETGAVDFEKAQNNAEIIKHFVHFFIPKGFNEAMSFMHSYRGTGVKTLFYILFSHYFSNKTQLVIQMNPLSYDNAVNAWLDAVAKEVRLTKFVGVNDIADQVSMLGHHEQELVIKPPRKNNLGKLKDYLRRDSERFKAIEIMGGYGSQIKTIVEMNGKQKTFYIGGSVSSPLCEIELDEDVVLNDGVPDYRSIRRWIRVIVNEYAKTMYPGLNIKVA
ncbi:hypothetical protein CWB96_03775 [Pseudoalteromonas citrea]|uniref:Uncharacterized protein n=2 Tax=Pseudoalteromonas TaxID=53246 RepID=A0A5S3XUT8_9GAMM|nr:MULTISPECIES: hypothetical protein [Pseudoalteromonas]PCK33684.1 hypothetical protein CEX98_00725 [Pseudoalteromonas piscicida]TMP45204.1 hypothetical protein CWB97_05235 [Pseudoalteromonas citrea]TMP61415.1 hypothetical protein CWB96_03775 [Pseudoalteromonas citrea]